MTDARLFPFRDVGIIIKVSESLELSDNGIKTEVCSLQQCHTGSFQGSPSSYSPGLPEGTDLSPGQKSMDCAVRIGVSLALVDRNPSQEVLLGEVGAGV